MVVYALQNETCNYSNLDAYFVQRLGGPNVRMENLTCFQQIHIAVLHLER